jgi:thiol:disulfide interchange protein DsbC
MKKLIPQVVATCLVFMLSFSFANSAEESIEDMTRLLKLRLGTDKVEPPTAGRYVFIGDMVDLKMSRNMTEVSRRGLVVQELASFDSKKQIVFPAENEELAVLNVFTDTSCGYCQQLHKEVKYLQEAGISVHYFPYPRGGNRGPGYSDLKKVWCADDKLTAMSIAKGAKMGSLASSEDCESALYVDEGYILGNRIGVTGTPALYTSDGTMFNGYVPHQQLIPQLLNQ